MGFFYSLFRNCVTSIAYVTSNVEMVKSVGIVRLLAYIKSRLFSVSVCKYEINGVRFIKGLAYVEMHYEQFL